MGCNEPCTLILSNDFRCLPHLTLHLVCCVCGHYAHWHFPFKHHYTNKAQSMPVPVLETTGHLNSNSKQHFQREQVTSMAQLKGAEQKLLTLKGVHTEIGENIGKRKLPSLAKTLI